MKINLKIKYNIIAFSFLFYFFFWSYLIDEKNLLRYLIFIPLIYSFFYKEELIKINIHKFLFIPFLLLLHYFIMNLWYSNQIILRDIYSIILLTLIIYTYFICRNFIHKNLIYILKSYFIILIIFSLFDSQLIDYGSCSSSFFSYFPFLKNLSISKGFFSENSHLAMVNIAALLSSFYYFFKKKDYSLLILASLCLIINIFNLSTTFLLGYLLCSILFIVICKNNRFKIFLAFSSIIFLFYLSNTPDCSKKYTYFELNDVKENRIKRDKGGALTSTIYVRSAVISLKTLKEKPLGWGYDGTLKATNDHINPMKNYYLGHHLDPLIWELNTRDALGNIFKLVIEFGYLNIFLLFIFFRYLIKSKISEIEIFFLTIFIIQLFRGAGYINGGFIIAFSEIFLARYIIVNNRHPSN